MDAPKSFHDRMSTVLDAITAACPPSKERKRSAKELDDNDMLDEEVHSFAPPTPKRYSPQHRDRSETAQSNRGESNRSQETQLNRGERNRRNREQRRNLVPFKSGYTVNPSKWTKYDLGDDGTQVLSMSGMSADQVNKYAAFEFLKECKKSQRDSSEGNEEEEEETGEKVLFKKPVKATVRGRCERVEEVDKTGAGAGVHVMQEYKVGERKEFKRGRGRKQLKVLGQRLDKMEEEEVMEKRVRSGEKKGRLGDVSLCHLEQEEL